MRTLPLNCQVCDKYNSRVGFTQDLEKNLDQFKTEGFRAVKFHYGKVKQSEIRIQLSKNEKSIIITYFDGKRKPSTHKISSYEGLLYGALSSTFMQHQQRILAMLEIQKESRKNPIAEFVLRKAEEEQAFHSWECFSLIKGIRTHDFKIKDEIELFKVLQVFSYLFHGKEGIQERIRTFKILKFKIKVSYECFLANMSLAELLLFAISETAKNHIQQK